MLFCSPTFLIFFLSFLFLWWLTPPNHRLSLIIIGSLFFYGYWNWSFLYVPILLTFISYLGAKWIDQHTDKTTRKQHLIICISIVTTPLLFFKYFNFFAGKRILNLELPLGISFITFTLIAYLVDVYKKEYEVEKNFTWLLGFVSFFPQLIAGPILRPKELLPQLKKNKTTSNDTRIQAIALFTVGLAKKLIIADQLKPFIDSVYLAPNNTSYHEWLIAVYGFAAQIYCDFSGYSDMAVGLALFFGIVIPINFKRPFLSSSISMVWRRWHITLSEWFRDYIYYPMGGRQRSTIKKFHCQLFTMSICGLWHGAGWTYIIWGFLNGLYLGIEHVARHSRFNLQLPKPIKVIITFHWWAITVIFVRAYSVPDALNMIKAGFHWSSFSLSGASTLIYPFILLVLFYSTHFFDDNAIIKRFSTKLHPAILVPATVTLWLIAIVLSSGTGGSAKFFYFDF